MKKALILGATGAMGVYLVPELVKKGYFVDAVSLDDVKSDDENVRYITGDGTDVEFVAEIVKNNYDVVIDFMIYFLLDDSFEKISRLYLENCKHYFFLSTYRIYANEQIPITEESPRLLEASDDEVFLGFNDYALFKARGEDIIRKSGHSNWTIVRPSVTFSKRRLQLTILEADVVIYRAQRGKKLVLPEAAMDCQATMTWAGDVAKMFAGLANNPVAYGETYTFATSEHHTWRELAQYYNELIGLEYVTVDTDTFLGFYPQQSYLAVRHQLLYDRCYERIIDNSKVLRDAGLTAEDITPVKQALTMEIGNLPPLAEWKYNQLNDKMDEYLKSIGE